MDRVLSLIFSPSTDGMAGSVLVVPVGDGLVDEEGEDKAKAAATSLCTTILIVCRRDSTVTELDVIGGSGGRLDTTAGSCTAGAGTDDAKGVDSGTGEELEDGS